MDVSSVSLMSEALLKEILGNAIKKEEQAYDLYTKTQNKVKAPASKALLSELAETEREHKQKLLAIIERSASIYWAGISQLGSMDEVEDLKIVDYVQDPSLSDDADYPTVLLYSAKREKEAFELYSSLAKGPLGQRFREAGEMFSKLAEEELIHKNRLEREYEELALKED
jgi:rubrerythrin